MALDRITEQVRSIFPITWAALAADEDIGDSVLGLRVQYVENLILGFEPNEEEQDALNALVVEFLAKSAAVEIITPAIDYWKEQEISLVTTGTSEQTSYADRIRALENLGKKLLAEIARLEPIVEPLLPVVKERRSSGRPLISSFEDALLTSNPQDFGVAYGPKTATI